MESQLKEYLLDRNKLKNFLFNNTNFNGDTINPDFRVSDKSGENYIIIRETKKPYLKLVKGSDRLENIFDVFEFGEFTAEELYVILLEIEIEYQVQFDDIVID